jgi:ABC-type branched-subunit amino acid transport system substrate-binding protein
MRKRGLLSWLIITGVALPLLLCGSVFAKEKLGIAFMGDLTGPLGFWNAPRLVGLQDAMEYVNETYGGIGGREVYLDWVDTKSKIDIATSGYERLMSKGYLVWHTCGTGEQQMLKARYEEDRSQIYYTCSCSPNVIYPAGYVFGTCVYYPSEFGAFADWLVENWDYKKMGRNPRVAIMTYGSGLGKVAEAPELLNYYKKKGIDIVTRMYVPFVTVDAVTPLMKAKKAGADWITGIMIYQTVPPYLNANYKMKLGLKFWMITGGVDPVIINLSKPKEAALAMTGSTNWVLTWEDKPLMNIMRKVWEKKNRRPEDRGTSAILGWMNMMQTKAVYEDTLKRVGTWDKITAVELRKTSESWEDLDVGGLGKVSYSKKKRGVQVVRIAKVMKVKVNGKDVIRWEYIGGWRKVPSMIPDKWKEPLRY